MTGSKWYTGLALYQPKSKTTFAVLNSFAASCFFSDFTLTAMTGAILKNSYWFNFQQWFIETNVIPHQKLKLSASVTVEELFWMLQALPCSSHPFNKTNCGTWQCYLLLQLQPMHLRGRFVRSWCDVHVQCKKKAAIWKRVNSVLFTASQ